MRVIVEFPVGVSIGNSSIGDIRALFK